MSFRSGYRLTCVCAAEVWCYETRFECEVEDVLSLEDIVESCYAFDIRRAESCATTP